MTAGFGTLRNISGRTARYDFLYRSAVLVLQGVSEVSYEIHQTDLRWLLDGMTGGIEWPQYTE